MSYKFLRGDVIEIFVIEIIILQVMNRVENTKPKSGGFEIVL